MKKQQKISKRIKKSKIIKTGIITSIVIIGLILSVINNLNINKINYLIENNLFPNNNIVNNKEEKQNFDEYINFYHNKDIYGRLEIPNLFNILLVQGKNNEYYLNHSIDLKENKKGTEFIDYRITENSKQINVYGHNSKTYNLPFHKLEQFKNEKFFNNNQYIILETKKKIKKYQILSFKEIVNDYEHMQLNLTKKDYLNHIQKLKENSIFSREIPFTETSNILIIQTCSYDTLDSFYILVAVEV